MNWIPTEDEVAYYKTINQDKNANADTYKVMLPLLLEKVNEDYGKSFTPNDIPANVKIFLAKATQFFTGNTALKSRSMGTVSYSFDFTELPPSIMNLLMRYGRVKVHVIP